MKFTNIMWIIPNYAHIHFLSYNIKNFGIIICINCKRIIPKLYPYYLFLMNVKLHQIISKLFIFHWQQNNLCMKCWCAFHINHTTTILSCHFNFCDSWHINDFTIIFCKNKQDGAISWYDIGWDKILGRI